MTTPSGFSTGSPISNVPYEILHEIFIQCLPQHPLAYRQPDPMIAPVLLCHICSSWRTVALASRILWVHLHCCLTIVEDDDIEIKSRTIDFDEDQIEFIQWWRLNHGSVAPVLSLGVNDDDEECDIDYYLQQQPAGSGIDFLIEYIASAQYLELDDFYWNQIHRKIEDGYQAVFPNLHTLLMQPEWTRDESFYLVQSLVPAQTQSMLRRLSIGHDVLRDEFIIPNHWLSLSHISLEKVSISLPFWFSLIRAAPSLRWGYFEFSILRLTANYTIPPQCTHLQLSTLSVSVHRYLADSSILELSLLFTGLHLPALHTLSLSSPGVKAWRGHRAITELYNILKLSPAITKLVLEDKFLSLNTRHTGVFLAEIGDVDPVWIHAAQLTHLQLDIPDIAPTTDAEEEETILDIFVHNVFSADNKWLDLRNRSCPVRTITLCTPRPSIRTRDLVISKIQKHSPEAPDTAFQITFDPAYLVAAVVRNDWGPIF